MTASTARFHAPRRRRRGRLRAALHLIGIGTLALLYGSAYGAFGFYIAVMIDAFGVADYWPVVWLLVWVAFGAVVLTVWTIRWTGIGAKWFQTGQQLDS